MDKPIKMPDWHSRAHDRYYLSPQGEKSSGEWDIEQAQKINAAGLGLQAGDLKPFAEYLKSEYSPLEPDLALELVSMIEGDGTYVDFILTTTKHSKLASKNDPTALSNYQKKEKRTLEIALYIAGQNGHRENHEAAITSAKEKFNLSRSSIELEWGVYLDGMSRSLGRSGYDAKRRDLLNDFIDQHVAITRLNGSFPS